MWRDGAWAAAPWGKCSRKPRCVDPAAGVPCLPRPAPCHLPSACFPGFLLLCISMTLPFSSPSLCILHLYRRMLLQVSFILKPWSHKWRFTPPGASILRIWGGFTAPNSTPPSSNFHFMGCFFFFNASYNKPVLNTNAHFRCVRHFRTAWIENLGKMLQRSNGRRNTLLFLLLIRNKTQVRPHCRRISY